MKDIDLNTVQLLMDAARRDRPQLNEKQAILELAELMARFLHYQDSGEPVTSSSFLKHSLPVHLAVEQIHSDAE